MIKNLIKSLVFLHYLTNVLNKLCELWDQFACLCLSLINMGPVIYCTGNKKLMKNLPKSESITLIISNFKFLDAWLGNFCFYYCSYELLKHLNVGVYI